MKTVTILLSLLLAAFVARAEQQPSFRLTPAAKRKLAEKAVALKIGDSFQTVTNVLGTATFDQPLLGKDSREIVGRDLKYFAVIWQPGSADESQNELVDVTLDKGGRVRSVYIRLTLH
jgi:hypothetical protein